MMMGFSEYLWEYYLVALWDLSSLVFLCMLFYCYCVITSDMFCLPPLCLLGFVPYYFDL